MKSLLIAVIGMFALTLTGCQIGMGGAGAINLPSADAVAQANYEAQVGGFQLGEEGFTTSCPDGLSFKVSQEVAKAYLWDGPHVIAEATPMNGIVAFAGELKFEHKKVFTITADIWGDENTEVMFDLMPSNMSSHPVWVEHASNLRSNTAVGSDNWESK